MRRLTAALLFLCLSGTVYGQTFDNAMNIPPLVSGRNIRLDCDSGQWQIYPGSQTRTFAFSGNYLGPTIELQKWDSVDIRINNRLGEETSVHWHGLHVPAEMDGGPETTIPALDSFTSSFRVLNRAGTYWYHPHVHMNTQNQVTKGMAGLIMVRDSEEMSLPLPRTYGYDDLPVVLQDRKYNTTNQFLMGPMGDSMLVNGTPRPYRDVPDRFVRLRILNGSNARVYQLGFSDNRTFFVISSDGGLLAAPVPVTRIRLANGERAEILVDFSQQAGSSCRLRSFATELPTNVPGNITGAMGNNGPLDGVNFDIMEFRVNNAPPGGITALPSYALAISTWDSTLADRVRNRFITGQGMIGMGNFYLDGNQYIMGLFNDTMRLGDIELWHVTNNSNISHPMHIHDVSFRVLARNGQPAPDVEQGWKDVFNILPQETVSLIMRFEDFTNPNVPYMYHCHNLAHEDMGMMTSFIVVDTAASGLNDPAADDAVTVYPNPSSGEWRLSLPVSSHHPITAVIRDTEGRCVRKETLETPMLSTEGLAPGLYIIELTEPGTPSFTVRGMVGMRQ
ncbi:MAG: hypothetical protein RL213_30 [Bacteroidota bacterium]|jgi:bilirubin oxidase